MYQHCSVAEVLSHRLDGGPKIQMTITDVHGKDAFGMKVLAVNLKALAR